MADFTLHRPSEEDWAAMRELRIRALTDTPSAFLETREQALQLDEQAWRARVRRNRHAALDDPASDSMQVIAIDPDGRWIGSMVCFISDGPPGYVERRRPVGRRANLVGVFVDPAWRGDAGVTDSLLNAVAAWVAEKGLGELHLHVNDRNERARRAYLKRGFRPTGEVDSVPDAPGDREVELVMTLPRRAQTG
jgi:RimJ/RimL family protein N-acetyltransferase